MITIIENSVMIAATKFNYHYPNTGSQAIMISNINMKIILNRNMNYYVLHIVGIMFAC